MKEFEPSRLRRTTSYLLVMLAGMMLFVSAVYFVSVVFFEKEQWNALNDAWPSVLMFSSVSVLVLARAFFKPLQRLDRMDNRIRKIVDNMSDGLQVISPDFRYIYVNKAVAIQGKTTQENLIGHTMMEVYPGIEETHLFRHLQQCMQDRIEIKMKNKFTFPDGTEGWFRLHMQPVPEGVMILSIDLTQQLKTIKQLKRLNAQLQVKSKQLPVPNKTSKKKTNTTAKKRRTRSKKK